METVMVLYNGTPFAEGWIINLKLFHCCLQELTRLHESETGMDSPRAESELDLATSDFSVPELLQVCTFLLIHAS